MSLEQLWAGWRNDYVSDLHRPQPTGDESGCVFCRVAATDEPDDVTLVVHTGSTCLVVLNVYPYTSGHVMVMPKRHAGELGDLSDEESSELWTLATRAVAALTSAYSPGGINLGANLGKAAGAGIPEHLHVHCLPRWIGDTNFTTTVAGLRVMPETLTSTWQRLVDAWPKATS